MQEYKNIKLIDNFVNNHSTLRKIRLNISTRSYTGCMALNDRDDKKSYIYIHINPCNDLINFILKFMDSEFKIKSTEFTDNEHFIKCVKYIVDDIQEYINNSFKEEIVEIDFNTKVLRESTLNFKTLKKHIEYIFQNIF